MSVVGISEQIAAYRLLNALNAIQLLVSRVLAVIAIMGQRITLDEMQHVLDSVTTTAAGKRTMLSEK